MRLHQARIKLNSCRRKLLFLPQLNHLWHHLLHNMFISCLIGELPNLQLALLQVAEAERSRDEEYRLGEVSLSGMSASIKMDTDDKIKACVTLQSFTLEDQRPEMTRISSRVVTLESTRENGVAADICWTRETDGDVLESTFQRVYVCGSLDFLISVSHFFLDDPAADVSSVESLKESEPEKQHHIVQGNLKAEGTKSSPGTQSITVIVHVESPELVFVADMSRADAPAIVATMECHGSLRSLPEECNSFLVIRGLRLTAMAFLKECREDIAATVLHPCDLYIKSSQAKDKPPFINFVCASFNLRVSPVIINTIMSIFAAMTMSTSLSKTSSLGKDDVDPGEAVCEDLWKIKALGKDYQPWYLEQKEPRKEAKGSWSHTQAVGSEAAVTGEKLQLSLESFVMTLEGGVGNQTTPLLLAEAGVMGSVQNWRSFPSLQTSVSLQVSSYNEVLGVWEPLVEPIQTPYNQSKPWSLNLKLCQTGGLASPQTIPGDEPAPPLALTEMTVSSEDSLNLTVTTRGLEVMTTLLKAFSEATKGGGTFGKDCAPLVVTNALGIAISLSLGADICIFQSHKHDGKKVVHQPVIELSAGKCIELDFSKSEALGHTSVLLRQESTVFSLSFTPAGYSAVDGVPLGRLGSRVYSVYPKDSTSSGDEPEDKSKLRTMLVCNIESQDGVRHITIRSLLQVINHCGQSFKLLHRTGTATYETIGIVPSTGEFCVPLIYASQQLYLAPDSGEYETSTTYIWGKSAVQKVFEAGKSGILWVVYCPSTQPGNKPLWLSVRAQPDEASFVDCSITGCATHTLHLSSTVCLRNFLPYSISCLLEGVSESQVLDSGHAVDLMQAGATSLLAELTLKGYQGRTWRGKLDLNANPPEYLTITFLGDGWGERRAVESVTLALHSSRRDDQLLLTLFAPYWLVNKTGRLLQYRPDSSLLFRHPSGGRDPILYTHQPRGLFSKNKMKVSVGNSSFSGDFSLDTVGSSGCLYCKVNQHVDLQVGVKIQMSSWGLTKIVTFTPFFVFINKSSLELEVMEEGTRDSWIYLPPNELSGFWPVGNLKQLRVRKMGTNTSSKVFNFSRPDGGTVLRLPEKPGGVHVDITVVENSAVINFSDLQPGTAPFLLVNHLTGRALEYNQVGCEGQRWLLPEQAVFYTWDEPCKDRRLHLSCEDKTLELDPLKNGDGVLPVDVQAPLRWACFLDGMQRVFVLTSDVAVVARARDQGLGLGAGSEGEFLQKIDIALNEMTVSLVNSNMKQEIAFMSFTSSGIIWEEKRHRWKPLKLNLSIQLEKEYKHPTEDKIDKETKGVKRFSAGSGFEFELSTDGIGRCLRPYSCPVRRSFIPAFSMTYQAWSHQRSLEVKLFRLQVDNQLPGAIFSTVFNPLAPPKSIALDSVPKSFVDMSAVVKCNEYSSIMQIRYLKVLIQEMGVQLDARFLNAFLQTIYTTNSSTLSPQQKIEKFHEDLQLVSSDLPNQSFQDATSTLLYLEFLHFSPLKLHLSLSLSSTGENEGNQQEHEAIPLESLNLLLQNLGATLADSQDLVFKMACFEVKYQFYTETELMWAVIKHYSNQFLQQLYVVVLGLDVLGNPFGLLRGLSQGVESLFYEPYQGAIQGPEEFAEGMAIGVKSFFGHAVGGAAGVVSRLTGTVGKGLAAITMDEEFQQKRQEDKNRQAQNFKDNLARGGKGLLQGVVGGVTGIITKPVEGAKKEGAAGFFKGIGKGLVGVVARPTGGVVDMASSTLEGLKRVAESSENIHRIRPPRVIRADGIVRSFTSRESEANLLLQTAEDGQYSSDRYFAHVSLSPDNVKLVLITNRRLMLLKRDVLEQLDCVWQYPLETVMPVACQNERVTVFLKTDKAKNIVFPDARTAEWFVRKLEEAQLDWREQKMQPGTS
uniref:Vacuolar protein sorting 13 homolog C n=1 Tax=Eptatretus burgeri TaxID=7764 RepID=A0A8C4Q0G5_EPTBU